MASPTEVTPLKELNQSPLENQPESATRTDGSDYSCKCKCSAGLATPDRLKVPIPFKYPERYTSPTDHIMSPISKGLAKSRRGGALLPPSKTQSKIHELRAQDARPVSEFRSDECKI